MYIAFLKLHRNPTLSLLQASGTPPYIGDPTVYTLAMGNDGIVDVDTNPLNLYHPAVVDGFWAVDLQGESTSIPYSMRTHESHT